MQSGLDIPLAVIANMKFMNPETVQLISQQPDKYLFSTLKNLTDRPEWERVAQTKFNLTPDQAATVKTEVTNALLKFPAMGINI